MERAVMTPPSNGRTLKRIALLAVFALAAGLIFALDLHSYLSFESLSAHRADLLAFVEANYLLAVIGFIAIYVLVVALSIPGAVWLTLGGGFVFGTLMSAIYIVSAATLGAIIVFLIARYVLGDAWVHKLGKSAERLEKGFQENEMSYLLVLRLVPIFPFWLVNVAPALLGVKLRHYVLTTFFGIIPGTAVYASVGSGLGALFNQGIEPDLSIIVAPEVLGPLLGLAALAMIPVAYNKYKSMKESSHGE